MPTLTCKTRLTFNAPQDKERVILLLQGATFCWNEISKIKFTITGNSISKLHNESYHKVRVACPYLPSNLIISIERSVLAAYKSAKGRKRHITSPICKKSFSLQLNKRLCKFKDSKLIISTLANGSRVTCNIVWNHYLNSLASQYRWLDPEIYFDGQDVWIQFFFDVPEPPKDLKENTVCGIDLGCSRFASTSTGIIYKDPVFIARKRKIRYLKRCLQSKMMRGSRSAAKHFKKINKKEGRLSKNLAHHLSKKLVSDIKESVLVVEDLRKIQVRKNNKKSPRIAQVPFALFIKYILYKAALCGKTVIKVNPAYTSKEDHRTGLLDGARRGCRYYTTSGEVFDADVNAAINIAKRSELPVSQSNNLTYGQVIVNSPIVR